MDALDHARPIIVTTLLCLYLPVPFVLLWFNGLLPWWRRWGAWSYALHTPMYLALVVITAATHRLWAWGAWDWADWLRWLGAAVIVACLTLLAITYRDIDLRTLIIFRQIRPDEKRRMITTGIYGSVRHPRYALVMAGAVGNALLAGTPAVTAAAIAAVLLSLAVTRMEERELMGYFGEEYARYARRVPAFIPRRYRRASRR